MRLYRAKVDCWYLARLKTGKYRRERPRLCESREFLLEVDSGFDVATKAVELAEATAACSEEWLHFEFREAASVTLPVEIVRGEMIHPTTFRNVFEPPKNRAQRRAGNGK